MSEVHRQVKQAQREIGEIRRRISQLLRGKAVRITSEYQPSGSERTWKGKTGKIITALYVSEDWEWVVLLDINKHPDPWLRLDELEFLEEE